MEKILEIKRGKIIEREHSGVLILSDSKKILAQYGHDLKKTCYYLRSCAKPLQTAVLQDLGVFEHFNFSQEEIAVVSSSHSGSFGHISAIEGLLKKIGKTQDDLICGAHLPWDSKSREYLIKNNLKPSQLHNNCSGKHAGFLAACVMNGWDISNYTDFEHPLQKIIIEKMSEYYDFEPKYMAKDGCGAPIMAMPFENMCKGFSKCFQDYPKIQEAYAEQPYLIGGYGKIDSEIIFASNGRLISKVGAEGLCMVYNPQKSQVLLIKIADSSDKARAIVLIEALRQLEWLSEDEIKVNPIVNLFDKNLKNAVGDIVGERCTLFELSKSFVKSF
ncbi:MAG: asparaginase [bacterium]